ncbi:MAG: T9SS type A sorting domain-containing protein [Flavobacteriales bacterium]
MKKILLALLLSIPTALFSQTITVTQPNGTEILYACQTYTVSWSTSGAVSGYYDIDYSLDGGTIWASVTTNYLSPSKTYAWTVPNIQSGTVLIRVRDSQNGSILDQSNAFFTINIPVIVTAPNGGETFTPLTTTNITWNAQGTSNTYNIAYSVNGGGIWTNIITNYSTVGATYTWTVPNIPSTNCLIRVQDAVSTCMVDQSNSTFTIVPLTPLLTYPNGGEQLNVGQNINILWNQNTFYGNVRLEYTLDNGLTWNNIATSTTNDGSEAWTIPYLPQNRAYTQCLVRVSNSANPALNDVSNVSFTIRKPLTLTAPNGGETLTGCNTFAINATLQASGLNSGWGIYYSTDNGSSWNTIIGSNSSPSYTWSIPNTLSSSQGLIRVVNNTYPQYSDTSDAVFSFGQSNDITVTAPNGGESLIPGQSYLVSWTNTANVSGAYTLSYTSSAGSGTIVSNITGNNHYWTVPNQPATNYILTVRDDNNSCKRDVSDAPFTVNPRTPKLLYPNGGENFNVNQTVNIDWDENTYYSSNVRIEYSDNGGLTWNIISSSYTTSYGSYSWTVPVPSQNVAQTNYLVKVSESTNLLRTDQSDNTFNIRKPFTLLAPNGGESFYACNPITITSTFNFSGSSSWRYEYSLDNGSSWTNLTTSSSPTSYSWTPTNNQTSNQALVRIYHTSYPQLGDTSNAVFSIAHTNDITVTAPNGGEVFTPGQNVLITWTNTPNVSGLYDITGIASNITGNSYLWTVPNNPTTTGLITVRDANNTCRFDRNDSSFTILQKTPKLLYPNGGENFNVNQTVNITWDQSSYYSSFVRIEYSDNGGLTWNIISSSYTTSYGSYSWTVPVPSQNVAQTNYLVKVSESTNLLRTDQSDNTFNIRKPVTLLTPNGGENVSVCNTVNISSTVNYSGSSTWRYEYSLDNGATWAAMTLTSSPASYTWTTSTSHASTQALVRISHASYPQLSDTSNAVFTIQPQNYITVTAPNGGQVLTPGQTYLITWTNIPDVSGAYNVSYLTSTGGATIASNLSANSYLWTVPNQPATDYTIRVSDNNTSCKRDQSDSTFTVVALPPLPAKMLTPNGGEVFNAGQAINITWDPNTYYSTNVSIEYSTNGGLTWNLITNTQSRTSGSYTWTTPVPSQNAAQTQLLVKVSEATNPLHSDVSDSTFSTRKPFTLLAPNGGEVFYGCNPITITGDVKLSGASTWLYQYSLNNGATWTTITTGNGSSYTWNLQNNISSSQVRVRVSNMTYPQFADTSDAVFSIQSQNYITVTAPNGGQVLTPGQSYMISWNNLPSVSGAYSISYQSSAGNSSIASNISGNNYLWTVPNLPATDYTIRVSDYSSSCKRDDSDSSFTVLQKPAKMFAPNGGEVLYYGQSYTITWDNSTYYENVRIDFSTDNGTSWNLVSTNETNDGSYTWGTTARPNIYSTGCLIKISHINDLAHNDVSDAAFTIKPAVTILTPNGGQNLGGCTVTSLSFDRSPAYSTFSLQYSENGGSTWTTISSSFNASGNPSIYNWTLPNNPTTQGMVRVTPTTLGSSFADVSDATFTVIKPVTIIQPNYGGTLQVGSTYTIAWQSDGISNFYDIFYSIDGGTNWVSIAANYPTSNNTYSWTVPNTPSGNCLIRVRDAINTCKEDVSDVPFTITTSAPLITVLSPNGQDTLAGCSTQNIQWTAHPSVTAVNIAYSLNGGSTWVPVVSNYNTSNSYAWNVPNTASNTALVRVTSFSNNAIFDQSDALFYIMPSTLRIISPTADTIICSGQQVQLVASGGNGTYSWTGAGLSSNSISSPMATPPGTTQYVVSSSSGSCILKDSVTITVSNNPALLASVSINANPGTSLCTGNNVSFTAIPVNGGLSPAYQWMHNGAPAGTNTAVYTPATVNNNDQIWVVMTSSQACVTGSPAASLTSTISITPSSTPTVSVSASPGTTICAGSPVQFTATALNAGSNPVYQWKVNGINVGTNSAGFTSSALSNGDVVTVEVQSSLSCASPASASSTGITMSTGGAPAQPGSISGPAGICSGNTVIYTVTPVAGATSYIWTLPSGWTGSSTNNAISVTTGSTGGTISVSAVNACGTSNSTILNVSINASPSAAQAGNDQQVCATTATLAATSPLIGTGSWTVLSGNGSLSDPTLVNPVVSNLGTGINAFVWSVQSGGCQASTDTVYIQRFDAPTVADAGANITVCQGTGSVTLQGNTPLSGTGQWSLVSGTASIAAPGNAQSLLSNLSTGVHVLQWTISNGVCAASSDQVSVVVEANPVLSVNTSASSVCPGTPVVLSASGAASYTWQPGNLTGNSVVVTPSATTIYTVNGTNAAGCSSSANITVNVTTAIPIQISASDTVICPGDIVTLQAGGAGNYVWMPGNLTGNSIVVNPTTNTTYTVSGSNAGCTGTASLALVVQSMPAVSISGNDSICQGQSTTLTAGGATSYTWMPGNLTGSSISVTPGSTTQYTVTGTNNSGCSSAATRTVHVQSTPAVSASASATTVCAGQTVTLNASGAQSYNWMPGNLSGSSVTVTPATTTTYTVSGSNAGACSSTAQVQVSVNTPPSVNISATQASICAGTTTTLTASGADTYTWMPGNLTGSSISVAPGSTTVYTVSGHSNSSGCSSQASFTVQVQTAPNVQAYTSNTSICQGASATLTATGASSYSWQPGNLTGSSISVTPSSTTTYVVTGTDNGCSTTATVTVQVVNNASALTLTASDNSICAGETVVLNVSGANSYLWQHNNATGTISTVSPATTTSYTVTGTTANGCSASASILIQVNTPAQVNASASQSSVCAGAATVLTAGGAVSYNWNPGAISGSNVTVYPTATTTYTVTGTDANGCQSTAAVTVNVQNTPSVSAATADAILCAGENTTLTASGATSYLWTPGNMTGASISVSPATSTTYQLIGLNGNCSDTTTITITVNSLPNVQASAVNPSICAGSSTTLNASGAVSYVWTPGNLGGSSITVSPSATTSYTVTGTDNNNCTNTASLTVSVLASPSLTIHTSSNAVCAGEDVTLSVNGNGSYTWQPGNISGNSITVSPSATTSYTVSDNAAGNCNASASQTITVNALPVVSFGPIADQCNLNPAFALTQGAPAGGIYSGTGVSGGAFDPGTGNGNYVLTYTYTDANGCTASTEQHVEVYGCLGVDEETAASVTLFPNPTHGDVYIQAEGIQIDRVELYNDLGAQIGIQSSQQNGNIYFPIQHLSDGIYFVRIYSGDKVLVKKVIKNH